VVAMAKETDRDTPLYCGIGLGLAVRGHDGEGWQTDKDALTKSADSFDPNWCNAILIYTYAPSEANRPTYSVDWGMRRTLPVILAALTDRGWSADNTQLIGVPQAFNYSPRTGVGTRTLAPRYRARTDATKLAAQISAFCAAGAVGIVGYAWDDGSRGNVDMLATSPELQQGFMAGVKSCPWS